MELSLLKHCGQARENDIENVIKMARPKNGLVFDFSEAKNLSDDDFTVTEIITDLVWNAWESHLICTIAF